MNFLIGLWPIFSKYSVAALAVAGLLAFAFLAPWPFPRLKRLAVYLAAAIAITTAAYTVGVHDGENHVQAQWDAARAATIEQGEKARTDAERSVPAEPDDRLRNAPYNRDRS
jgi:hypothetical protein